MSLLSENVIPGNHGKVFSTNAKTEEGLTNIKNAVEALKGVKDCQLNTDVFPHEFTVHAIDIVSVKEVQDAVLTTGYHSVPKHLFPF
jgi:hypothetical protein